MGMDAMGWFVALDAGEKVSVLSALVALIALGLSIAAFVTTLRERRKTARVREERSVVSWRPGWIDHESVILTNVGLDEARRVHVRVTYESSHFDVEVKSVKRDEHVVVAIPQLTVKWLIFTNNWQTDPQVPVNIAEVGVLVTWQSIEGTPDRVDMPYYIQSR